MKNIGFLHNMLPPQYCVTGPRWVNSRAAASWGKQLMPSHYSDQWRVKLKNKERCKCNISSSIFIVVYFNKSTKCRGVNNVRVSNCKPQSNLGAPFRSKFIYSLFLILSTCIYIYINTSYEVSLHSIGFRSFRCWPRSYIHDKPNQR